MRRYTANQQAFDARAYFDEGVAARYDQGIRLSCPSYDALHRMIVPLLQLLPEQALVLSAGAGTGAEILTLGTRFLSWRFVGIDLSRDMLQACASRIEQAGFAARVSLFAGRIEDYAPAAPFDAATSIFVGHFIQGAERKLAYFRAIAQRLKPGAPLIVADLHGDKGSPGFVELLKAWLLFYVSQGANAEKLTQDLQLILRDIDFVPENELIELLAQAGFGGALRFYQSYLFGGWIVTRQA